MHIAGEHFIFIFCILIYFLFLLHISYSVIFSSEQIASFGIFVYLFWSPLLEYKLHESRNFASLICYFITSNQNKPGTGTNKCIYSCNLYYSGPATYYTVF